MFLRLTLPLLFVTAAAAGCAAPTDPSAPQVAAATAGKPAASAPHQTCRREYRMGSNIPVVDCSAE